MIMMLMLENVLNLGVHKFAPSLTVWVDMGWITEMVRLWNRLLNVSEN